MHGHIRRFPIKDLPQKEEELKQWLYNRYKEKDQLLEDFKQKQTFPEGAGGSQVLDTPRVCAQSNPTSLNRHHPD